MLGSDASGGESDVDLATLVRLVAEGVLVVEIGWRGSWPRIGEAAKALRERRINGKAVLDVAVPAETIGSPSAPR